MTFKEERKSVNESDIKVVSNGCSNAINLYCQKSVHVVCNKTTELYNYNEVNSVHF